jgi:hypothetical protein
MDRKERTKARNNKAEDLLEIHCGRTGLQGKQKGIFP